MYEKLDNPVYHSLNEYHQKFCLSFGDTKFYTPEVVAFGGSLQQAAANELTVYQKICDDFLIFGAQPAAQNFTKKASRLVCDQ
jgi:hypothetical protein